MSKQAEWDANDHQREEDWFDENYTPIKNKLNDNASFEGCMFETFGDELKFIMNHNTRQVWTVATDDYGDWCICSGFHYVNRIGYLVTEEVVEDGRDIFVKLDMGDDDDDEEDDDETT